MTSSSGYLSVVLSHQRKAAGARSKPLLLLLTTPKTCALRTSIDIASILLLVVDWENSLKIGLCSEDGCRVHQTNFHLEGGD